MLPCPDRERLIAFLLGHIVGEEATALAGHLAECAKCQAVAEGSLPPDLLLSALAEKPEPSEEADGLARIDELCEHFEDAWQAGQRPRIADYLGETEELERDRLLRELIGLDIDYRRQLGEKPTARDYHEYASSLDVRWLERLTEASRYELADQIGRGGMGDVRQGYDRHLRRDLAVKMLRSEFQDQPHMVRRFLREAWIGARLQHPGIVPVYDLGEFADRQPFFTMKWVRGHTLETLLRERGNPTADLPRLLTIFEQVCQTVAYAHAQGVIHRDLKPANIMVGAFGEVQVMDWGLAKVLDWAGEDDTVADRDVGASKRIMESTAPGLKSQAGHAIGTYAYMPPEQARGEVDRLDERSDVFGLGAILCEILVGTPPFHGENKEELLERVKACDHREALARLDGCGADATLLRLTKACLAAKQADRPRNAGKVAEAVKAYLVAVQERFQTAERERAAAQARAEEAKKTAAAEEARAEEAERAAAAEQARAEEAKKKMDAERKAWRRTVWLAAAVLLFGFLGGGWGLWWWWQRAELVRTTDADLAKVRDDLEKWKIAEAHEAMERAEGRVAGGGPSDLRQRVQQMRDALTLWKQLEGIRLDAATMVEHHLDFAKADRDYATIFRERGLAKEGEDPEVVAARIRSSAIKAQLVAALDDWATATKARDRRAWLLEVARRAEPREWSDRFRDPAVWEKPAALNQLAKNANVKELSPQLLEELGWALMRQQANAQWFLTAAQQHHPADFWINFELGNALVHLKKPEEAIGYYRAAMATRPEASTVHINLGVALRAKGDLVGAIAECRKAIELDPKDANAHSNLGFALYETGDLVGAIAECRKAIELNPKDAYAHNHLGVALRAKGDLVGAVAEFRKAIELDPKNALAHNNLGLTLLQQGRYSAAGDSTRRALELLPKDAPLRQIALQQLQQCKRFPALEKKLSAVLNGEKSAANPSEVLELAQFCQQFKKRHAAARLYADAFTAEPKLAADWERQHRYNAACSAALAAAGQGEDARSLPDKVAAMFRRWALDWLRDDLKAYVQLAEKDNPATRQTVRQRLTHWREDPDLAGLRDKDAVDKLPEAERDTCRKLWADVETLLHRDPEK